MLCAQHAKGAANSAGQAAKDAVNDGASATAQVGLVQPAH